MPDPSPHEICASLLRLAGLPDEGVNRLVSVDGRTVLPSSFRVTDAATALVGAVGVAISMLAERCGLDGGRVEVDPAEACVAFQSERHLRQDGAPRLWDDLAGHYRTSDGFVQFHTNFAHHRAALLQALDLPTSATRADAERVVAGRERFAIERDVAAAGGIAAAMRSPDEWRAEPHALHVADQPPLTILPAGGATVRPRRPPADRPLTGLRVLDMTRVIAGPVCARTLAAFGADVLRVGADELPVVEALLPDTTLGKRFAHADVTSPPGRDAVLRLATEADVVVTGFRPGALAAHGLGVDDFLAVNPSLVVGELSAFGADGPWGGRRGFDSITQTATGVVAAEMAAFESAEARPLPCQLLDHGSGFLLALGVLASLLRADEEGGGRRVSATLLSTRTWLESLGPGALIADRPLDEELIARFTVERDSPFGRLRHAVHPGTVDGVPARWDIGPSRPGTDQLQWA